MLHVAHSIIYVQKSQGVYYISKLTFFCILCFRTVQILPRTKSENEIFHGGESSLTVLQSRNPLVDRSNSLYAV